MKRALAFLEASLYATGVVANHVVATVKLNGVLDEAALRVALTRLQQRHALLGAHIDIDHKGIAYFVTTEPRVPIPIEIHTRQGNDHWKSIFIPACLQPFAPHTLLMRLVWLQSQMVSDLVFVCHHAICDGRSVLTLINETLQILAQPTLQLDTYDAATPLIHYVPAALQRKRSQRLLCRLLPPIMKVALWAASFKKEAVRNTPYFLHWKLDIRTSTGLLYQCKKEGVTIHALLGVLFLAGFQSLAENRRYQKLFCSVDMRRFIPQLTPDMLFGFPAMVPVRMRINLSASIWQQAKQFHQQLQQRLAEVDPYGPLLYTERLQPLVPALTRYAQKDRGKHAFTFSNMGRVAIQEQYGGLIVEALHSPACIFPFGNPSTLCVTTFGGQLDLLFTSDENFLTKANAELVYEKVRNLMEQLAG